MVNLAQTIKHRRGELGLSIDRLAARSGVNPTTIHHIERGRTVNPNAITRARLEQGLELPAGSLIPAPESPIRAQQDDSNQSTIRDQSQPTPPRNGFSDMAHPCKGGQTDGNRETD